MGGGGSRRGVVRVAAVLIVVVGLAQGVVTEVAADLLPGWLAWLAVGWRAWWVLVTLLVVAGVLAALSLRPDDEGSSLGPRPAQLQAQSVQVTINQLSQPAPVVAQQGQLIVGELPSAPPAFVERAAVEELVGVFCSGSGGTAVVCAISGGRGVGKTQTAAAYGRLRAAQGCPLVAWASGATPERLWSDLSEIATAVGVADPEGDSRKSAKQLRAYLQGRAEPSVLVIDNAVDPGIVRPLLPAVGRCEVILTSRNRAFEQLGRPIAVRPFQRVESVAYLLQRTGINDVDGADRTAHALGDLPVALAQAATVIQLRRWTFHEYLQALGDVPASRLLPHDEGNPYPHGAAEALLLSVRALEQTDPTSTTARVLETVAFLAPEGVSRWLLRTLITGEQVVAKLDDDLARLVQASVLAWTDEGSTVTAHQLLTRVMRDRTQSDAIGRNRTRRSARSPAR